MLHFETVESNTLSILKRLQQVKILQDFYLVGGTALSLLYGHRISVDLDLFSNNDFDREEVVTELINEFGDKFYYEGKHNRFGVFCYIDNIKVDLIYYPHPIISPIKQIDEIRMYNDQDILAMKIQAILGRGKKKDFFDLAVLLERYSIVDCIRLHKEKYPNQQFLISIPMAVTYFDDAEESEDPISLNGETWESVKKIIQKKVSAYLS